MKLPLPLRQWTSEHSLQGLSEPTWVTVEARVASPNETRSPVTGMRAAMFRWQVFSRETDPDGAAGNLAHYTPVQSGLMADGALVLSCEGRTILLPFPGYEARFRVNDDFGDPIEAPLPAGMLPDAMPPGLACYRELPLLHGDPVRLTARILPLGSTAGGAYRSAHTTDFIASYDEGPAVVEDLSPSPG